VRYVLLAALLLAALGYQVRHSVAVVRYLAGTEGHARAPVSLRHGTVREASPDAAALGVAKGDRVTAVNGEPYRGRATWLRVLRVAQPGDALALTLARAGGEVREVRLSLAAAPPLPLSERVLVVMLGLFQPWLCLGVGFTVAFLRPHDRRAWFLLLMLIGFCLIFGVQEVQAESWDAPWRVPAILYHDVFSHGWFIWILLFGVHFPERVPLDQRWPWVKWLVIGPLAAFAVLEAVDAVALSEGLRLPPWLTAPVPWLGRWLPYLGMLAIGSFFASLGYSSSTATNPDARRRLKLLYWGATVGLTPTFLLVLGGMALGRHFRDLPIWATFPALMLTAFFPLTLAYVIVVHRALSVHVVVRQGLQYALAAQGVRVLQVLIIVAVAMGVFSLAEDLTVDRPWRIVYLAIGVWGAFLVTVAAQHLRGWVDRRFFREAYDAERVLTELSENVRTMMEAGPLLETVVDRVSQTLHVPQTVAFVGERGAWRAACVGSEVPGEGQEFPEASATVRRLKEERQPVKVRLDDPQSWAHREAGEDRDRLSALNAHLLLPLAVKDTLLGFLVLGPKLSEEAYSPSDVRLLRLVAAQTALALQNSQLTAAMAQQVAQSARMNREIEIAREVQEGLFPQELPRVHGLVYAGYCRPARGVGGDYYDFVESPGGGLGIAIGDVSGKGIPAALLMASLRAALRTQAMDGAPDLARLVSRLNRLIYEATGANRYATFFYGQYDPATRRLEYVNAGHNPPFVFRGADGEAVRLEGGGPVIGLLPEAAYEAQVVTLAPGDLLVAYTDGISEAMNAQDEEWGEERMAEAVQARTTPEPQAVVEALMTSADQFAAGAPQHDDMTLVVARVT
jgi:phosphoserine phosphatase RsbU/P